MTAGERPAALAPVRDIDHLVLTVRDVAATVEFYERVLGMRSFTFAQDSRTALSFAAGERKVNLHEVGREHLPNVRAAGPGTADLCFLVDEPIDVVAARLHEGRRRRARPRARRRRARRPALGLAARPRREPGRTRSVRLLTIALGRLAPDQAEQLR